MLYDDSTGIKKTESIGTQNKASILVVIVGNVWIECYLVKIELNILCRGVVVDRQFRWGATLVMYHKSSLSKRMHSQSHESKNSAE